MITPSFGLTATEQVLPKLALDFTTATLDPRITFTRSGNTATYTNSSGVITAINADLPRFDYNPTTLVCQGLLIEEARTNIILNSLINGTILNTQIVTTSATAYTLSFYGTGNVVLTGTHSATVTGTGAYPSRKTYTFTPTAGALTLTVSGTVQYAQLEAGSFATSFIPTSAASVTRNADVATMTGTNFSSWYNASEGCFRGEYQNFCNTGSPSILVADDGTAQNMIRLYVITGTSTSRYAQNIRTNNVVQRDDYIDGSANTTGAVVGIANCYKNSAFGGAKNGQAFESQPSGTVPTVNQLRIGHSAAANSTASGWYKKIFYYPQRLINNEVQAFSKL